MPLHNDDGHRDSSVFEFQAELLFRAVRIQFIDARSKAAGSGGWERIADQRRSARYRGTEPQRPEDGTGDMEVAVRCGRANT